MSENENKNIDAKPEEALKGIWDSLTDEQKEKAKDCKTLPELVELLGKLGVSLPEGLLDGVAGGGPLVLRKTPPQKEDRDTSGDGRTGRVGALLR